MTISSVSVQSGPYTGNGSTDTYNYDWKVDSKTELKVYEIDDQGYVTLLTVDTDYTVNNIGSATGTVTRVAGNLPIDYEWLILANLSALQQVDFPGQGDFHPETLEDALDRLTRLVQQQDRLLAKAITVEEYDTTVSTNLSIGVPNAGKALVWNDAGDGIESSASDYDDAGTHAATASAAATAAQTAQTAAETAQAAAEAAAAGAGGGQVKNFFINPQCTIRQRTDNTPTGPGGFYHDRWQYGGSTVQILETAFTEGQTDVPHDPKHYAVVNQVVASDPYVVRQWIEDYRQLAGEDIIPSFYAKVNTGTKDVKLFATMHYDSSADVTVESTTITLTTSWQQISAVLSVPALTGKTLGAEPAVIVGIKEASGTSAFQLHYVNAQCELANGNTTPGDLELRSQHDEWQMCYRYYYKVGYLADFSYAFDTGNLYNPVFRFPVRMRKQPSIVDTALVFNNASGGNDGTGSFNVIAYDFISLKNSANNWVANHKIQIHNNCAFDAEFS